MKKNIIPTKGGKQMDFLSQNDINELKNFLTHKEIKLFHEGVLPLQNSILDITNVQSLKNITNPNAHTYIIDAKPESVDVTLEVTNRNKDVTELLITQNSDRFSSEKTVSFPTDKLTDVETIRSLRDIIKTQYKSDTMRTLLHNSLPGYYDSSVEETKNSFGKQEFTYTLWGHDKEPVRFVMNETLLDLPPRGGSLKYQEFNTFTKEWETKVSYISEALMSTKDHVSGNDTIVGVPKIYGENWSMTNFITNSVPQRTVEQETIMSMLHRLANPDPSLYGGININTFPKSFEPINKNFNIAYKIPDIKENRICDLDVYIYPTAQELKEPNEHTKRFIMRYQQPTDYDCGYLNVYEPTTLEPELIARKKLSLTNPIDDIILLTNRLKEISEPIIQKQVTQKKQLSHFSLNHPTVQEKQDDLEP